MKDKETPNQDYLTGFNQGYILQKYLPEIGDKLAQSLTQSERSIGFQDGQKQCIKELKEERYPSWLKSNRLENLDNDLDISPDKYKEENDLEK